MFQNVKQSRRNSVPLKPLCNYVYPACRIKAPRLTPDNSLQLAADRNVLCRTGRVARTHHINGIDVGELVEELTTAEGELGISLEELLPARHRGQR